MPEDDADSSPSPTDPMDGCADCGISSSPTATVEGSPARDSGRDRERKVRPEPDAAATVGDDMLPGADILRSCVNVVGGMVGGAEGSNGRNGCPGI